MQRIWLTSQSQGVLWLPSVRALAGHSHWQNIRHIKAAADFKRSKVFSKHATEIRNLINVFRNGSTCTVEEALKDAHVRAAIDRAKADNMPKDKIEKAVERGCGLHHGGDKVLYEVRGFGGVGILLWCETDNKNRTNAHLRQLIEKAGTSIAPGGQVSFAFDQKAVVRLNAGEDGLKLEDKITELALEAGAEDVKFRDGLWELIAEKTEFGSMMNGIKDHLEAHPELKDLLKVETHHSGIDFVPKAEMEVDECDEETREKNLNLFQELSGFQDFEHIVHNMAMHEGPATAHE